MYKSEISAFKFRLDEEDILRLLMLTSVTYMVTMAIYPYRLELLQFTQRSWWRKAIRTKTVYTELAQNLSTQAFIDVFDSFISRRDICLVLYCGNGTQFVGTSRVMDLRSTMLKKCIWKSAHNIFRPATNSLLQPRPIIKVLYVREKVISIVQLVLKLYASIKWLPYSLGLNH